MIKKLIVALAALATGSVFGLNMNFQNYNGTDKVSVTIIPTVETLSCANGGTPVIAKPNAFKFTLGANGGNYTTPLSMSSSPSSYCFSGKVDMKYATNTACEFDYYYDSTDGWKFSIPVNNVTPPCNTSPLGEADTAKFCIWGTCK